MAGRIGAREKNVDITILQGCVVQSNDRAVPGEQRTLPASIAGTLIMAGRACVQGKGGPGEKAIVAAYKQRGNKPAPKGKGKGKGAAKPAGNGGEGGDEGEGGGN